MVTLKQLAKELGVSISTVSKALNNSEEIGEDTVRRVKELAELYNYKPNKVALSLKNNKTKTIGVIIPNILNRILAKVLFGIETEAAKHGYNIITCISNESLEKEKQSLQLLANGSVDGFILSVAEETQINNEIEHFKKTISQGLPIVMFDRVAHDVMCDKVIVDDFDAMYNATKSLLKEKRKNIVFISNINDLSVGKLRERGYNKAILEHGVQEPLVLKIKRKKDDHQKKIKSFLKKNRTVDAVIAADSSSGVIALNTAINLGLKVPKEFSVIAFASKSDSNHTIPKLTTIRQHAKEIGVSAAQMLIARMQNLPASADVKTKIVKTSIVKNKSTL
ncbi:LacI family DNA-binding transcriptional regulator [Algibacter lectus]|uniref:LacI family transcriptional regulator n=1 Tax=Algibacter lectus TaxID=221126 RepID=A0A090VDU2_9FLAO|nr:LacI family DNA-binding transcriptional regulator [Algibacter lectus]MDO7136772.1 LacI family DNA-binding transcriptional regulator [Algibacter lectus]MWW24753.1 substrate-binding domain-containing protein [Algibacter lectus]TDY62774.1 LacI family transcriptional regulator [Algibacter lectus]SFC90367.1 transcriptional regulator, LacI family [Algibacter lectus]GAL62931.1 LacI family transcriptional regulator [Algibacter lectus]